MTRYRKRYEVLEVERLAEGVTRLAKAVSALIAVSALYALACAADGWVEAAWGCAAGLLLAASAVQTVRWWFSARRAGAARAQLKSLPARRKVAGSVSASSVAASSRLHVPPPPAAAAAAAATASSDENLAALQAAQLRASGQFTKGRALMQAAAKANPRSEKAHVLLCELCNDEASSFRSKTAEQEEALRAGSTAAEALMLGFPTSASGWKWSAVFLARLTSYKPLTEKLADGLVVKTHALKALSLDKTDALVNHVMGAWKLNVANLTYAPKNSFCCVDQTTHRLFFAKQVDSAHGGVCPVGRQRTRGDY